MLLIFSTGKKLDGDLFEVLRHTQGTYFCTASTAKKNTLIFHWLIIHLYLTCLSQNLPYIVYTTCFNARLSVIPHLCNVSAILKNYFIYLDYRTEIKIHFRTNIFCVHFIYFLKKAETVGEH